MDKSNGDTLRENAIQKEMAEIDEYNIIKPLPEGSFPLPGNERIPYHFMLDVKFDLRRKAKKHEDRGLTHHRSLVLHG